MKHLSLNNICLENEKILLLVKLKKKKKIDVFKNKKKVFDLLREITFLQQSNEKQYFTHFLKRFDFSIMLKLFVKIFKKSSSRIFEIKVLFHRRH